MAFTRDYSTTRPSGSDQAKTADDEIRIMRVDMDERLSQILGISTMVGADPLINGTTRKSITDLVTLINTKPSINATNNVIPKRSGSGTLSDSIVTDTGSGLVVAGALSATGAVSSGGILSGTNAICSLTHSTTQSVTAGSTIQFDTASIDPRSMHPSGGDRITATTAAQVGYYLVLLQFNVTSGSGFLSVNNTTGGGVSLSVSSPSAAITTALKSYACIVRLNAVNDYMVAGISSATIGFSSGASMMAIQLLS